MADLEQLLSGKEIALVCGSGGVGKTTTAAALGLMMAVHTPTRVLVVTVDPARRLATALGLNAIGNAETPIEPRTFRQAGAESQGELWVAMLDTKQGWDELIRRHAPTPKVREAILANVVYQSLSERFTQSHDYLAAERLYELHSSGRYDLIVVDTPPSRHALDLLSAPANMAEFFGSRLLRWLTMPSRSRVLTMASKPFYQIADRILGTQFLGDLVEFFSLLQTMESGFVERAHAVEALFEDRRTTFVVVSTLEASPVAEARFFINELVADHFHLGGLILNKVLPPEFAQAEIGKVAATLRRRSGELAEQVEGDNVGLASAVFNAMADNALNMQAAARREQELCAELTVAAEVTVMVPYLDGDITDFASLIGFGSNLLGLTR